MSESTELRKRIGTIVGEEVQRQTTKREADEAFSDDEPKHDPSAPGRSFATRVLRRLAQERLASQ